jgi:hypothetical protein
MRIEGRLGAMEAAMLADKRFLIKDFNTWGGCFILKDDAR